MKPVLNELWDSLRTSTIAPYKSMNASNIGRELLLKTRPHMVSLCVEHIDALRTMTALCLRSSPGMAVGPRAGGSVWNGPHDSLAIPDAARTGMGPVIITQGSHGMATLIEQR